MALHGGWEALLQLQFAQNEAGETVLVRRLHKGPLRVQKALYPEHRSVCHAIILHPPGGVAGGDCLTIEAIARTGSHALLTTPGAGKWYKSAGRSASQSLQFKVEKGSVLEWLPQETILFDGADGNWKTHIDLEEDARYMGWEIVCYGRTASGEKFSHGKLRQETEIYTQGKRIWGEYAFLKGGDRLLSSLSGLANRTVSGTFLIAGFLMSDALLSEVREIHVDSDYGGVSGITRIGNVVAIRYLGFSSERARQYFIAVWKVLRHAVSGHGPCPPRIWNT